MFCSVCLLYLAHFHTLYSSLHSSPALRLLYACVPVRNVCVRNARTRKELRITVIQHLLISFRIIMQYYYRLSIGHYSANLQKNILFSKQNTYKNRVLKRMRVNKKCILSLRLPSKCSFTLK